MHPANRGEFAGLASHASLQIMAYNSSCVASEYSTVGCRRWVEARVVRAVTLVCGCWSLAGGK